MSTPSIVMPNGFVSHVIPEQAYAVVTAKGSMPAAMMGAWQEIWQSDFQRKFTTDFEIYDAKSQQGDQSEGKIYLAV